MPERVHIDLYFPERRFDHGYDTVSRIAHELGGSVSLSCEESLVGVDEAVPLDNGEVLTRVTLPSESDITLYNSDFVSTMPDVYSTDKARIPVISTDELVKTGRELGFVKGRYRDVHEQAALMNSLVSQAIYYTFREAGAGKYTPEAGFFHRGRYTGLAVNSSKRITEPTVQIYERKFLHAATLPFIVGVAKNIRMEKRIAGSNYPFIGMPLQIMKYCADSLTER